VTPRTASRRRLAAVIAVLGSVVAAGGVAASPPVAAPPAIDADGALSAAIEARMAELLVPGAVVLVRTPEWGWMEAFGTRAVGADDPVTTEDHFRIGSNTKTMTGTVLLQLVDEDRVALDDPVSKFLPDVPNGDAITVEQLLTMRSGLYNYSELLSFNVELDEDPSRVWVPEELAAIGLAEPVYFAPGEGFHYSNTNTVLAGLIVEQLTGSRLEDVFAERLFEPLGLTETSFPAIDIAGLPEPHPRGYLFGTNVDTVDDPALPPDVQAAAHAGRLLPNDVTELNPSWGWAAGAAISTAEDLATYVEALIGGEFLSPELQRRRLDSLESSEPGNPDAAGYGLALAQFGPMIGHDGSLPGFQSFMGHDPGTGTTLIVLTNLQAAPSGEQVANELAMVVLGELYR